MPVAGRRVTPRRRQGRNEGVGYDVGEGANDGIGSSVGARPVSDGVGFGAGSGSAGSGAAGDSGRGATMSLSAGGVVGASLYHAWYDAAASAPASGRHRRTEEREVAAPVAVIRAPEPPDVDHRTEEREVAAPVAVIPAPEPPDVDDRPLPAGVDLLADDDTDPVGFAPVSTAPSDPGEEPDPGFILPGWGAPPLDVEERIGRVRRARKPLLIAGLALFLVGVLTAILFAPRLVGASTSIEAAAPPGSPAAPPGSPAAPPGSPAAPPGSDAPPVATSISGPVGGVSAATFDLVDGAGSVTMRAAPLGADLYRVATPAGSDVAPRIERAGSSLKLFLPHGSKGAPDEVDILLNADIRWTLRLDGGAVHKTVDLTRATVDAIDLSGGARTIELALPAPQGLMPVRMAGGVDQFRVSLPGATPVRVRVQSGAGAVTLPGSAYRGIAPGRSFTANGWGSGATGVDLLAEAGMAALTVTAA
jgi:hypothetical protein